MLSWSRNFARTPLVLLGVVEALVLFLSVYFACVVAFGGIENGRDAVGLIAPRALTLALIMLLSLIATGLYQFRQRIYFHEVVVRLFVGVALGSAVLAIAYYAFPGLMLAPRIAALSVLIAVLMLLLLRFAFVRNIDENRFRRRTLIYGAGERAGVIDDLKRRADRRGFKIVGTIAAPGDKAGGNGAELLDNEHSLAKAAMAMGAEEIVVAMDDRRGNLPVRELLDAKLRGINVIDLLEFLERETGKINIDLVSPGWLIFSPGFRINRFRRVTKRLLDLFVSVTGLLFAWPIMLLVVLCIKLEDGLRAPVIYRQHRVGLHGDLIDVLKFRSMRIDAESDGKAVWADADDARVTRVGSVIRKLRFDELPQILNVLSGQMSVVGPRPERPEFVKELDEKIPYYSERHTVPPGVTGWAQLKYPYGASIKDSEEKLRYDLYYVKNHSLMLDLMIILQTVEVILWGKGAR